jgi:hypothetical protein
MIVKLCSSEDEYIVCSSAEQDRYRNLESCTLLTYRKLPAKKDDSYTLLTKLTRI